MSEQNLSSAVAQFVQTDDANAKDAIWKDQCQRFRDFWKNRVLQASPQGLSDGDYDPIIRIVDRNGKGNTKDSEAVAKAMITQGTWRRMFNEFHREKELSR